MALGKGIGVLIPESKDLAPASEQPQKVTTSEVPSDNVKTSEVKSTEVLSSEVTTSEVKTSEAPTSPMTLDGIVVRPAVFSEAIASVGGRPTITTWSMLATVTLKCLKFSIPNFSMSDEIKTLVESGLKRKYPELVKKVKEELEKKG
jgi:hypothetical protein